MILELDCGNSFIKWRVLEADAQRIVGEGVAGEFESPEGADAKVLPVGQCKNG
jgi:pantothenate kinase type III